MEFRVSFSILESIIATMTIGVGLASVMTIFFPGLSTTVNDLVKYGKSANKIKSKLLNYLSVPKRWFTHFYVMAVTTSSLALSTSLLVQYEFIQPDRRLRLLLHTLTRPVDSVTVSATAVQVTLALLWLHSVRRLFESLFMSVYSETEMNILHYVTGLVHYILLPLIVICESPAFLNNQKFQPDTIHLNGQHYLGVLMFILCSYYQHECLAKFAIMRRNHFGNIINYAHGIPYGGLFEYLSCPHFLLEIGIYFSIYLCLNMNHHLWLYILTFVCINQVAAALITHNWYLERFKSQYPVQRKAIIPFIL